MSGPYDLLEVQMYDEILFARPIAWDEEDADGFGNNEKGEPVKPVRWMSTCPKCGQLVEFDKTNMHFRGGNWITRCECDPDVEEFKVNILRENQSSNESMANIFNYEMKPEDVPFMSLSVDDFRWGSKVDIDLLQYF